MADSSFYIHNPEKLADADLQQILGLPSGEHIRLLFPMVVVDEFDGLKEAGKHQARWRASHTLGLLDKILNGGTYGILHRAELNTGDATVRGKVSLEIILDPPGCRRSRNSPGRRSSNSPGTGWRQGHCMEESGTVYLPRPWCDGRACSDVGLP
ncbi:hypothetical protein [Streptomyces sp. NPDC001070]